MNKNLEQILTGLLKEIDTLVEQKVNQKLSDLRKSYAKKEAPLMTVKEASEYLNLSQKTIYKYVATGKINYFKPTTKSNKTNCTGSSNTKLYFKKEELDCYLLDENNHYYSEENILQQVETRIAKKRI